MRGALDPVPLLLLGSAVGPARADGVLCVVCVLFRCKYSEKRGVPFLVSIAFTFQLNSLELLHSTTFWISLSTALVTGVFRSPPRYLSLFVHWYRTCFPQESESPIIDLYHSLLPGEM